MSTFLERLHDEKRTVGENLVKLDIYIQTNDHFNTLSEANQSLLIRQRQSMSDYVEILVTRIELNS